MSLEGRSDDILRLPGTTRGEVAIHPITLRSPFAHCAEVRQYRVVHDGDGLHVLVVLRESACREEVVRQVRDALVTAPAGAGATPPALDVDVVDTLGRDPAHGAKYKLVESRHGE